MKTPLADWLERRGHGAGAWLACRVGISRSYLSMISSRKRRPSLAVALRLSRETGIPTEILFPEEEHAHRP